MANIEAQIKPTGLKVKSLVDCLYAVVSSIHGICAKLDADGGVPLETYEANCYTAIFNGCLENSRGDQIYNVVTALEHQFRLIRPTGVTYNSIWQIISQILDMMETLTEQLDTDTLTDSNYEALVYTAHVLPTDENTLKIGSTLGANVTKMAIDYLYSFAHMLHVLTDKLDDDGTVTDTTYEALWDTANMLMQIENSRGDVAGNALTKFNP